MMDTTKRGGIPLHVLTLLGFALGLGVGLWVNLNVGPETEWVVWLTTNVTGPIGRIFLRLLFMLVLPLLFSALVMGVAEMGDLGAPGRGRWKSVAMTVVISAIAVLIGIGMVNSLRPGDGAEGARGIIENAAASAQLGQSFLDLIPRNVFAAAAANQVLPVMVFALFFGIGLVMVKSPAAGQLQTVIAGLFEVMMKLIGLVIRFAPIAIACLMFNLAALFGWDLWAGLAALVGVAEF